MKKLTNEQISNRFDVIGGDIANIQDTMHTMQDTIHIMQEDINTLKSDIVVINRRLFNIENHLDVLDERTAYLPTLYERVDAFMTEIIKNRENSVFIPKQLANHESRITTLEKIKAKYLRGPSVAI